MAIIGFLIVIWIDKSDIDSSAPSQALPASLERYATQLLKHRATEPIPELPDYLSESDLHQWFKVGNSTEQFFSSWMLANEAIRSGQFIDAERHAETSISLLVDDTPIELRAKVFFDLSLAQIKLNKLNDSAKSFQQVSSLFDGYNGPHNEVFLTYFMKRAFELSHQKSSSGELVGYWEDIKRKATAMQYKRVDDVYYYLGTAYWNDSQFVKGVNLKIEAIEISLARKDYEQVQFMLTDVGIDYLYNGNYHEAIEQFNKAIEFNRDIGSNNPERLHYILVKLYSAYTEVNDLAEAEKTLVAAQEQLAQMSLPEGKEHYQTYFYAMQADLKRRLGDAKEALRLIKIAKQRHEGEFHARVYQFDVTLDTIMGDIYYLRRELDKAVEYHKQAENKIIERDLYYLETGINRKLYLDYLALNELTLALRHLEAENRLQVNWRLNENRQYSQYIYSQFETKEKEARIAALEHSKEESKWMFMFLMVVLLSLVLFTVMLKSKNNKIVQLNGLLTTLSNTDGLTGIFNRRAIDEYLPVWNSYPSLCFKRAIFMIDIDYFKNYNDQYGHAAGDVVLQLVAKTLKEQCGESEFVARYGGEEFVVVLSDIDREAALGLANRIHEAVEKLNILHSKSSVSDKLTLSLGLLTCDSNIESDINTMMKEADRALYQAKSKGRNQSCYINYCA